MGRMNDAKATHASVLFSYTKKAASRHGLT